MKQMKIALIAVMAVFMGTTFTSCLDSDNGPATYYAGGTIVASYGVVYLEGDNGVEYAISNPSAMQYKDEDGGTFYPKRATIAYKQIEGQDYTEGKTSYTVYFDGYYAAFFQGIMSDSETAESKTPLYAISGAGASSGFLDVLFACYYEKEEINTITSGIKLYPDEWKNGKLYFKLVQTVEVEKNKRASLGMCFPLPSKEALKEKFPTIEFTGDDQDIVTIVLIADGPNDQELSSESFKAKISD